MEKLSDAVKIFDALEQHKGLEWSGRMEGRLHRLGGQGREHGGRLGWRRIELACMSYR